MCDLASNSFKLIRLLRLLCIITDTVLWLTGVHLWRSEYGPFIHTTQINYCRRLIVVSLSTFHHLAELIGDPKGELIFLFHTARCGSTLLTQVVDRLIARLLIKKNSHNLKT